MHLDVGDTGAWLDAPLVQQMATLLGNLNLDQLDTPLHPEARVRKLQIATKSKGLKELEFFKGVSDFFRVFDCKYTQGSRFLALVTHPNMAFISMLAKRSRGSREAITSTIAAFTEQSMLRRAESSNHASHDRGPIARPRSHSDEDSGRVEARPRPAPTRAGTLRPAPTRPGHSTTGKIGRGLRPNLVHGPVDRSKWRQAAPPPSPCLA